MYYATQIDGQWVRCNISDKVPLEVFTSNFTEEQLNSYGVIVVQDNLNPPSYDESTHGLVDTQPTQGSDGKWYANYVVIEKGPEPTLPHMPGIQEPPTI